SQGTGDLTLTFQPGERWSFSNTTSINQTRISGDTAFVELRSPVSPADPGRNEFFFDLLSIRLISNGTDVNFLPAKALGFYGGYHYSIRRIQSREILAGISGAPNGGPLDSFNNIQHSGLAGIRVRPLAPLTVLFDAALGRGDHTFTPIAENRFHAETLKTQWKRKTWLISASFKNYRNRNTPPPVLGVLEGLPSAHSLESRQYSAGFAWTPNGRYSLDASYAKIHLDTASGIVNFPLPDAGDVVSRRSLYLSNLHTGHLMLRVEMLKRASLLLGYSVVKDTAGAA